MLEDNLEIRDITLLAQVHFDAVQHAYNHCLPILSGAEGKYNRLTNRLSIKSFIHNAFGCLDAMLVAVSPDMEKQFSFQKFITS